MNLFEYVGVLVSIVVGLALAHILTGVSRTIQVRHQVRHQVRSYWVHSLWTLNITVYLVFFWWFMDHWSAVERWSFFLFARRVQTEAGG